MQNKFQENFPDRILYYLSRSISSQGIKGDNLWNYKLEPVYGIFFLNFHLRGFEPMPIRTIQFKVEDIARMAHLTEEERIKYNVSIDMIRTHLCVMRNERR